VVLDPMSGELSPPRQVVGVVEDVRYHGPLGSARGPYDLWIPFEQQPSQVVSFAVHTSVPPAALAPPLQRAIGRLSPASPMHWISTMEEELEGQLAGARFYGRLTALYSTSAALLALLGVYGVMANAVARRGAELAVRAAVGARRGDLLRLVLGEGLRTLLAGLALGTAAALLATRSLRGLLHGVTATDPASFAVAAVLLLLLGMLACWLPARRAAAADPAAALRGS
jgi:predicted lysophospholipase L1 biosynthesis ABC-type transport system permease subunit